MRDLSTSAEQRVLLPKQSQDLYMVLFHRGSMDAPLRVLCSRYTPIDGFELVSVDLDVAAELADRFALANLPVLAAVFDGTILSIDDELGDDTCHQLAELAIRQRHALLEVAQ